MRSRLPLLAVAVLMLSALAVAGHNPSDYPLRVHIYNASSHSHYMGQALDFVDGEGRANLYENGAPRGFDFDYNCGERLRYNAGYETYLARWKKKDSTLEILVPVMGGGNEYHVCQLRVAMKEGSAYFYRNGNLGLQSAADYLGWMKKVEYDPEHGKNQPIRTPAAAPAQSSADPAAQPTAAQAPAPSKP